MADKLSQDRMLLSAASPKPARVNTGLEELPVEMKEFVPEPAASNLSSDYVIAPAPEAVVEVQRKLANPEATDQVEEVLHSILQAEKLADALYNAEKKRGEQSIPDITVRTYDNGYPADVQYCVNRVSTPQGLNAFILAPIDNKFPIKLIFVGTKDLPGVVRDMEKGAAGQTSFEEHKKTVLAELNKVIGELNTKEVKIDIIGHSLGGADAQNLTQEIVREVANPADPKNVCTNLQGKKTHLNFSTSAAPTLEKEQGKRFAKNLEKAVDSGRLILRASAAVYRLDVVPTFGEQHLLAHRGPELLLWSTNVRLEKEKIYLKIDGNGNLRGIFTDAEGKITHDEELSLAHRIETFTANTLVERRADILKAASAKGLATCDVMSLCEEATVTHVRAKPFQHESAIFAKVGEVIKGGIEILHIKKGQSVDPIEKEKKQAKMCGILNRSSGIDRWLFVRYLKEAIKNLAIKASDEVAKIYSTRSPSPSAAAAA